MAGAQTEKAVAKNGDAKMQVGLGFKKTRLKAYRHKDRWLPPKRSAFFAKPEIFSRLCELPAKPNAQAIFDCAMIFDKWIFEWHKSHGEHGRHHDYSLSDLDEALTLDTTVAECPGIEWIVDLWERLGGSLRYTQAPMSRPHTPRFHVEPTAEAIAKLAHSLNLTPKDEVEYAILVAQFARMSLPLRTRLASLADY